MGAWLHKQRQIIKEEWEKMILFQEKEEAATLPLFQDGDGDDDGEASARASLLVNEEATGRAFQACTWLLTGPGLAS